MAEQFVLDFDEYAKNARGGYVPPGKYAVTVAGGEFRSKPEKGGKGPVNKFGPTAFLKFQITEGEFSGSIVEAMLPVPGAQFKGSDGYKSMLMQRWSELAQALGIGGQIKPATFLKQVSGKPLGIICEDQTDASGNVREGRTSINGYVNAKAIPSLTPVDAVASNLDDLMDDDSDDEDDDTDEGEDSDDLADMLDEI